VVVSSARATLALRHWARWLARRHPSWGAPFIGATLSEAAGLTYAYVAVTSALVKVGKGWNPWERARNLNYEMKITGERWALIMLIKGQGHRGEGVLLRALAPFRAHPTAHRHTEYFLRTPEVQDLLDRMATEPEPK
jgi:hypothetical protein